MKPNLVECGLCGTPFQFGPYRYDGKYLAHYGLILCMSCFEANWDGLAPHYEEKFVAHLRNKGLPLPSRNAKGWYPRDAE